VRVGLNEGGSIKKRGIAWEKRRLKLLREAQRVISGFERTPPPTVFARKRGRKLFKTPQVT